MVTGLGAGLPPARERDTLRDPAWRPAGRLARAGGTQPRTPPRGESHHRRLRLRNPAPGRVAREPAGQRDARALRPATRPRTGAGGNFAVVPPASRVPKSDRGLGRDDDRVPRRAPSGNRRDSGRDQDAVGRSLAARARPRLPARRPAGASTRDCGRSTHFRSNASRRGRRRSCAHVAPGPGSRQPDRARTRGRWPPPARSRS